MDYPLIMRRCLDLARWGSNHNRTNPIVGSVLVDYQGNIVSENYFQRFGGPHAERNCLADVAVKESDHLFVSLEPCNVHGKTPPCRDLLIEKGVQHLHVGSSDPNPAIAGSSLDQLRATGIQVFPNVKEEEAQGTIRQFRINTLQRRPYIILKWAESADGFLAKKGSQTKLSNWASDRLVHKWRAEVDAILVGTNTAIIDNPSLTNRHHYGPHPLRLYLDRNGQLPKNHHLLDDSVPTIALGKSRSYRTFAQTTFRPYSKKVDLLDLLTDLYQDDVGSIIIEGGSLLLAFFIETGFWDEYRIITTAKYLVNGVSAPNLPSVPDSETTLLDNKIKVGYNPQSPNSQP